MRKNMKQVVRTEIVEGVKLSFVSNGDVFGSPVGLLEMSPAKQMAAIRHASAVIAAAHDVWKTTAA